ncbi:hypothetical protein [Paenibacillus thermotolerans]|uniref:hypothetical protein n=1 Tax=Paenibacillus thermotolerans TaxID=3027807 RepID=UPI002367904B|nr:MULTISPECIES: hypothetical protein [unclassified Paenibacillus]
MKRKKEKVIPNIVETYQLGNTTIHIADNFIARDPEEIERRVSELYKIAWRIVRDARERGVNV